MNALEGVKVVGRGVSTDVIEAPDAGIEVGGGTVTSADATSLTGNFQFENDDALDFSTFRFTRTELNDPSNTVSISETLEVESNNSLASAQNLDNAFWSLAFNQNIGDFFGNTSEKIPHLTVKGTGDGTVDYYSFDVANAGDRGIFDIDFGFTFEFGFSSNFFDSFVPVGKSSRKSTSRRGGPVAVEDSAS